MKMQTEGQMVNIYLDKEDVYQGHHQSEDGHYGVHEILVGGRPMKVYKHFTQIMNVFDHDGWEIEQITPGDGSLIKVPPIEVWGKRKQEGMTLREAREPIPYKPTVSS